MATPVYIKPKAVKAITPPVIAPPVRNIATQVADIKNQYGKMNTEQLYSAMLNVQPPGQADILNMVGTQYGYNDRLAGIRQQQAEIQKKMLGDQSALFSATNPDGSPVDPRVLVAQYQQNLTAGAERLNQLQKVQDVYAAEMQTLAGAVVEQYKAKAQQTQAAIQFMQQLNQEKNQDRSFQLQKDQFDFTKSQAGKPEWKQNPDGSWTDTNSSIRPQDQAQFTNTADFIKGKEGFRDRAYLDSAGIPTIGYGFTSVNGKKVQMGDTIDQGTADQQFQKQIAGYQNWKSYIDPSKLSKEQQTALTSFEYNLGSGIWKQDAMPILQKLQAGDIVGAQAYMKQYTNAGGKYVQGLANRRESEAGLLAKKLDGTNAYNPQYDSNLIEVLDNKYFDKTLGKSISGEEAQSMYGKTAPTTGPMDAGSGTPITYARRIKNLIPSTLQNSELEAKNINDTIKALYKNGVSPEDAALAYMGVDLKPEAKALGINMIDILKGSNAQPQVFTSIADAVNKGNNKGAVSLLENTLYKDRGVQTTDISDIGNNVKNGENLINRINKLKNEFGPITGNVTKWEQYVKNDKETQRLLSDMTNFVAKYRNGIAGTSVTRNEDDFLNNIIPTITNNPDNAIAKIQSNIGQAFNGLNTIRDTIGLPQIQDRRGSYDIGYRLGAYTGDQAQTPDQSQNQFIKPNRFSSQTGVGTSNRFLQSKQ